MSFPNALLPRADAEMIDMRGFPSQESVRRDARQPQT
jgi:hypothetical protein